jgi:hypothetical protein
MNKAGKTIGQICRCPICHKVFRQIKEWEPGIGTEHTIVVSQEEATAAVLSGVYRLLYCCFDCQKESNTRWLSERRKMI